MAGITINSNAYLNSDGTLAVSGFYDDTNGHTDTLTATVTQGLVTVGLTSESVTADGSPQGWSANLAPVGNAWSIGSAVGVAALIDTSSVQVAYAVQTLTIS